MTKVLKRDFPGSPGYPAELLGRRSIVGSELNSPRPLRVPADNWTWGLLSAPTFPYPYHHRPHAAWRVFFLTARHSIGVELPETLEHLRTRCIRPAILVL